MNTRYQEMLMKLNDTYLQFPIIKTKTMEVYCGFITSTMPFIGCG